MTRTAWPFIALLALPLAAAGYGEGSQLEAAAPATIEGRAETLLPNGIASFVSDTPSAILAVHLTASQAYGILRTWQPTCPVTSGVPVPCSPEPPSAHDDTAELTDVTLTVARPLTEYKILATTDRAYADTTSFGKSGNLVVTTAATAAFGTNPQNMNLAATTPAWSKDEDVAQPLDPVYAVEAGSAQLTGGGFLRATGDFELFLQGVQVTLTGTDEDGATFRETFDLRAPDDERDDVTALIVEVHDGTLTATSMAPLTAFGPADQRPIVDVHNRASFDDAKGVVRFEGGDATEYAGEPVTLAGPLSLTLTKIAKDRLSFAMVDGLQLDALADEPADEPIPPGALAAAGAAGAGGAGLLLALAYFWPRLKYAGMLALLPLYTRIERDAVLEHEKRDELYELIRATPGIHAHEIGEKASIGWGTTVYHLKLLENHGLIVSKKSGRYKRFFVNTGEYTKKKDAYGALRNQTAKAVADYIVNHPGTTQKEMCAALGIQPSLASWHVEKLEGVELVKRVKDGRMVRYFAGPAWSELNVRIDPLGGGAAPAET